MIVDLEWAYILLTHYLLEQLSDKRNSPRGRVVNRGTPVACIIHYSYPSISQSLRKTYYLGQAWRFYLRYIYYLVNRACSMMNCRRCWIVHFISAESKSPVSWPYLYHSQIAADQLSEQSTGQMYNPRVLWKIYGPCPYWGRVASWKDQDKANRLTWTVYIVLMWPSVVGLGPTGQVSTRNPFTIHTGDLRCHAWPSCISGLFLW